MAEHDPKRDFLRESAEARRAILRRATLYTYGLLGAAILVGLIGSAFIAWILVAVGLPFLKTWLVLSAVTIGVPALGQVAKQLRARGSDRDKR